MALTRNAELGHRMRLARSHGITRDPTRFNSATGLSPGAWYYEQQLLGFNYRMTDIHAALGMSQLARLQENVKRRNELAERYSVRLQSLALRLPSVQAGNLSAFHLYVVRLKEAAARARVFEELRSHGVGANVHYTPVHLQPYYRALGFSEGQFPNAEAHGREALTLPLFPALTETAQDRVIQCLEQALRGVE
jgi:dTDP-4-amino-4,6-dideoxygalactose transaminase